MLLLLSPSKKLNENPSATQTYSTPLFQKETQELTSILKQKSNTEIAALMGLSDALGQLNYERYQQFHFPFTTENAAQAIFMFQGDVYDGLDASSLNQETLHYANEHIRIISGLYGILRPFDLMQPYRLEMGTKLATERGRNLYQFWGDRLTEMLNDEQEEGNAILNLASNEYSKAINPKKLKANIHQVSFKEYKNGSYKMLMLYVKRARGMMARYIVENKIEALEDVKSFHLDRYQFNSELSSEQEYVFTRGE